MRVLRPATVLALALGVLACRREAQGPPPEGPPPAPAEVGAAGLEARPVSRFARLGARWSAGATTLRVFAPAARGVRVRFFRDAHVPAPDEVLAMKAMAGGFFEAEAAGDRAGQCYAFEVTDESGKVQVVSDPYAVCAVANSTRALVVPPGSADPPGWAAHAPGPALAAPVDAVIYETHIRDLTVHPRSGVRAKGKYLGWTEPDTHLDGLPEGPPTALAHLRDLGVTHVHILPVMDFENDETQGGYNWGYMPHSWFSPEGAYATRADDASRVTEFKRLVAALHEAGLGVVIDVVYNHAAHSGPLPVLLGARAYRRWPDGGLSNGSGCGNDLATEDPAVRRLVVESAEHWVREYDVDGFRFDIMGLVDVATMAELEARLRAIKPSILLYGEPWQTGATASAAPRADKQGLRRIAGIAAFNDDFRNALKGYPNDPSRGFIQDGSRREAVRVGIAGQEDWGLGGPGRIIQYVSSHDDLTLADKLALSLSGAGEAEIRARAMLAYLAVLTAQGVPFLQGGGEFLCGKGGQADSYRGGDEANRIDWPLADRHAAMRLWVRDLVALRRQHPVFRLRTYGEIRSRLRWHHAEKPGVVMFSVRGDGLPGEAWREALVVINPGNQPLDLDLPDGRWEVRLDALGQARREVEGRTTVPPLAGWVCWR